MIRPESRCVHVKPDGSRCGTTWGLSPDNSLCFHHDPRRKRQRDEARRRGAETTNRRHRAPGVDANGWDLADFTDAQAWLHRIAKAVLSNAITHNQASAATRAVESWMKAFAGGDVADQLTATTQLLAEIKSALAGGQDARESLLQAVQ
jgi:hypothetical protein